MFRNQRENLAHPGILVVYLMAGVVAMEVENREGYLFGLGVIVVLGFVAWILSLRRLLAMAGTPTSRIASAAQGYVELIGRGRNLPEFRVLSPLNQLPCVWYRYIVEQRTGNNKWKQVASGRSSESFILDDGSGMCVVDPEHAEVVAREKETWTQGDYRYSQWLILPQDNVYVLGEFSTLGGENLQLDVSKDVGDLLAEWKRNQPKLLERFDLDKDGKISEKEWMLARNQARRDVRKTHNALRTQPGTHLMHRPRDGRLFLVSNVDSRKLLNRYRLWAWLHLAVMISGVAGFAWLSSVPA